MPNFLTVPPKKKKGREREHREKERIERKERT